MLRRYLFALRPGWILFHLFVAACATTMVLLGLWQLHVSESKHFNLQNFGYSVQWWLFAAFAVVLWVRMLRDSARRRAGKTGETGATPAETAPVAPEPVAYRRYVMPTTPQPTDDATINAYNAYLAGLAARDAEKDNA